MSEIHLIGGEKGGVGKSVVSRLLAQYWIDRQESWWGYDADLSHGALLRYYSEFVTPMDLDHIDDMDRLVETAVETPESRFLVDLAAQSERRLHHWAEGIDLGELSREMNLDFVFWHVMDDGKDSVHLLERMMKRYARSVRYIVVLNAVHGDDFALFEESEARVLADRLDARIMNLRSLYHPIIQKIDRMDKSFWGAINNNGDEKSALNLMERQRVKVWLRYAYLEFDRMGLASKPGANAGHTSPPESH